MGNNKYIDIIPWTHQSNYVSHHNIMNFLKSLPNGQNIALEVTQKAYDRINRLFENATKINVNELTKLNLMDRKDPLLNLKALHMWRNNTDPTIELNPHQNALMAEAVYDIIFTCKIKGHNIIPIEEWAIYTKIKTKNTNAKTYQEKVDNARNLRRDKRFFRNLTKALSTKDTIFVVVGIGHVNFMLKRMAAYLKVIKQKQPKFNFDVGLNESIDYLTTKTTKHHSDLLVDLININKIAKERAKRKLTESKIKTEKGIKLKDKKNKIKELRREFALKFRPK